MNRTISLFLLGILFAPLNLPAQQIPWEAAAEPVANIVAAGGNSLSQPVGAMFYVRRLQTLPLGVGLEVTRAGALPQLQLRRERAMDSPYGGATSFTRVNHLTLGVLLSPDGMQYAGREMSAGSAAVAMLGSQLWPVKRQSIPLFLDLSAGVAVVATGMEGGPGAMLMLRGHAGWGW